MKFLTYLQESYVGLKDRYEIFVNPTSKELRDAANLFKDDKYNDPGIRFIADKKTKSLYVSNNNFVHPDLLQHLMDKSIIKPKGLWFKFRDNDRFLMGKGTVSGGKIKIIDDSFDFSLPECPASDFDWAKSYFTNFETHYDEYIGEGENKFPKQ